MFERCRGMNDAVYLPASEYELAFVLMKTKTATAEIIPVIRSAAQNLHNRIAGGGIAEDQRKAQTWALERLQTCLREYDSESNKRGAASASDEPGKRIRTNPSI